MTRPVAKRNGDAPSDALLRRAEAELGNAPGQPVGPTVQAFLRVAGRIEEEVARRLVLAPDKQARNFLTAMGVGRDPARAARAPVAFTLSDRSSGGLLAPAGTRLSAEAGGTAVTLETETEMVLAAGKIAALRGVEPATDAIYLAPAGTIERPPLTPTPIERRLKSAGAAGATKVQVDPASGLSAGETVRIGSPPHTALHLVTAVEGDLVTLAPALERTYDDATLLQQVAVFQPFGADARNVQRHLLHLGHADMLNVESPVTFEVSGADLPEGTRWSWYGQPDGADNPAWRPLTIVPGEGPLRLRKQEKGKLAMTKVGKHENLWLRAELTPPSARTLRLTNIRIGVQSGAAATDHHRRCPPQTKEPEPNAKFELIANTTQIVPNRPFFPLGRQPRLFDAFYVGSAEAFSKAGAEISLCLRLTGPEFGAMAAVAGQASDASPILTLVFSVGRDGVLYRARLDQNTAKLEQVPYPPSEGALIKFNPAIVAATVNKGEVLVAAATEEQRIWVGDFRLDADLSRTDPRWREITPPASGALDALALGKTADASPTLFAKYGETVVRFDWTTLAKIEAVSPAEALVAVQAAPNGVQSDAVAILQRRSYPYPKDKITIYQSGANYSFNINTRSHLHTAAICEIPESNEHVFAVYDKNNILRISILKRGESSELVQIFNGDLPSGLGEMPPIGFEPSRRFERDGSAVRRPDIVLAGDALVRVTWSEDGAGPLVAVSEPQGLRPTPDRPRRILSQSGWSFTQRAPLGLLTRRSDPALAPAVLNIEPGASDLYLWRGQIPPHKNKYLLLDDMSLSKLNAWKADGARLSKISEGKEDNETLPLTWWTAPDDLQDGVASYAAGETGDTATGLVELEGQSEDVVFIFVTEVTTTGGPTKAKGVWRFKRARGSSDYVRPKGFPEEAFDFKFSPLSLLEFGGSFDRPLEAVTIPREEAEWLLNLRDSHNFSVPGVSNWSLQVDSSDAVSDAAIAYPWKSVITTHDVMSAVSIKSVAIAAVPMASWSAIGPSAPANPELSWEYWNGTSWWSLKEYGLVDQTKHMLETGGVHFTAPADLKPVEVAGRMNHWVRARLVGGEYGSERVRIKTRPGKDPETDEPLEIQEIERDLNAIRAPQMLGLSVQFVVHTLVAPEAVLTEDNLVERDQTGANDAGLPVEVFVPVREALHPQAVSKSGEQVDDCGIPCPPPSATEAGNEICADSGADADALLIGFDARGLGDPVSLYVAIDPGGGSPIELDAEILRQGQLEPIGLTDHTDGLSMSGVLQLHPAQAPDKVELLGAGAQWVRLRPRRSGVTWRPRIRSLHLNAAMAAAQETREPEILGASTGAPAQSFKLLRAPIDPGSLELWVRELIGEDEIAALGEGLTAREIAGFDGPWVRWTSTPSLAAAAKSERVFTLDAASGEIRFGDGRHGRIPPPGPNNILARISRALTGAAANGLSPGDAPQLLSPIAGVEKTLLLERPAGGADVEAVEQAQSRGSTKLRHDGRLLTLADLEDFALAFSPMIGQARAGRWRSGVRLVVAARGADPVPELALRRELQRAILQRSGYGLARPDGLLVSGPRLLPLRAKLTLDPWADGAFGTLAQTARAALAKLFDVAAGGFDAGGWPIGRAPTVSDLLAALWALDDKAGVAAAELVRQDGTALPDAIPVDVLAALDPADISVDRLSEAETAA